MRRGLIRTSQRCCSESPEVFGFQLRSGRLMILSTSGTFLLQVVRIYEDFFLNSVVYRWLNAFICIKHGLLDKTRSGQCVCYRECCQSAVKTQRLSLLKVHLFSCSLVFRHITRSSAATQLQNYLSDFTCTNPGTLISSHPLMNAMWVVSAAVHKVKNKVSSSIWNKFLDVKTQIRCYHLSTQSVTDSTDFYWVCYVALFNSI